MDNSKILIVDDQLIGRQLLESILFKEDYELIFAEDGQQALDQIYENQPDAVLLDVMMPHIDGFEVCRRVRSDDKIKDTPIILVTALDDRDSRLNGFQAGANDYISKPIDRLELLARVKNLTQMFRYKKKSDSTNVEQTVTKVVENPEAFLDQVNQFLLQEENESLRKFFPDFFELINQTENKQHSATLTHEQNGSINLLYYQCSDYQFCNEALILLNSLFPKAVHSQYAEGLNNVFNSLIERLDKYFKERFQQSISDKVSMIWFDVNRTYHTFKYVATGIETRLFSETSGVYQIKVPQPENEFKSSDKILISPSVNKSSIENIQTDNYADFESFIESLTTDEQDVMIAGFTLG